MPGLALLAGVVAVAMVGSLQEEAETRAALAIGLTLTLALSVFGMLRERTSHRIDPGRQILDQRRFAEQYRLLFDQNPNPMWVYEPATLRFLAVNEAAVRHYGYSRERFLNLTLLDIRPPQDAQALIDVIGEVPGSGLWRHRIASGALIDVQIDASDVEFAGDPARLVLARDVTEERKAAVALADSENRYRDLFENATVPIATLDLDLRFAEVNDAFAEVLGYPREELIGEPLATYLWEHEADGLAEAQLQRKLSGEAAATRYDQKFAGRDGRCIILDVETRIIYRDGKPVGTQGICRDITAQRNAEESLRVLADQNHHLATHDALTALPNRELFKERLTQALSADEPCAVLLLDLDRFKEINDTLGHHYGDELLQHLAGALRRRLGDGHLLARLGGDEFAVLSRPAPDRRSCTGIVSRIQEALSEPFVVDGLPLRAEASIGIARFPDDGDSADLLLQHADIALYQAKRASSGHTFYRADNNEHSAARLQLLGELPDAIERHELIVHYQPKLDLRTGRVERVEALVRWQHPTRGLLPPGEFVEAAEQTALIGPLTFYVAEQALKQARLWQERGHALDVAVNLSTRSLADSQLTGKLDDLLSRYSDVRDRLLLEITESALVDDPEHARTTLEELRDLGIPLALDDFGSGYTSLAFLASYPLSQVKIDRAFIQDLDENPQHQAIVRASINLAHELNLQVVAEGVETRASERRLRQLGCDLAQGFYYTKPLPAEELGDWLRQRSRSIAAVA
jgi:diguanylate cyclase (GGDEF)-like protein/PAS domain S-box-containing protein